jgi:hypothetical protein
MASHVRYVCTGAGRIRSDRNSFDDVSTTPQLRKNQEYELGNVVSESKASWKSKMQDRPLRVQGL